MLSFAGRGRDENIVDLEKKKKTKKNSLFSLSRSPLVPTWDCPCRWQNANCNMDRDEQEEEKGKEMSQKKRMEMADERSLRRGIKIKNRDAQSDPTCSREYELDKTEEKEDIDGLDECLCAHVQHHPPPLSFDSFGDHYGSVHRAWRETKVVS